VNEFLWQKVTLQVNAEPLFSRRQGSLTTSGRQRGCPCVVDAEDDQFLDLRSRTKDGDVREGAGGEVDRTCNRKVEIETAGRSDRDRVLC
jgi:hypothetical protein